MRVSVNNQVTLVTDSLLDLLEEVARHCPLANQMVSEWMAELFSKGFVSLSGYNGKQVMIIGENYND